jgi:hypothetical protein
MNAKLTAAVFAALFLSLALTSQGEEPVTDRKTDAETIAELRREVEELKQTVNALRARLNELEYQGLPQAPHLLPEGKAPAAQPTNDAPAGFLRFPYDVERANFIWPRWDRTQRLR